MIMGMSAVISRLRKWFEYAFSLPVPVKLMSCPVRASASQKFDDDVSALNWNF